MKTNKSAFTVLCLIAAGAIGTASGFMKPEAEKDGIALRIVGFDEDMGKRAGYREIDGGKSFPVEVEVKNVGNARVAGGLSVKVNDDWTVKPSNEDVCLEPGESVMRTFTAEPVPGRVESAVYPVHARFNGLHVVGVFRSRMVAQRWKRVPDVWEWWTPSHNGPIWTAAERSEEEWADAVVRAVRNPVASFALDDGIKACVSPGEQGVTDGVIAFSDGKRTFAWRGFAVCVTGEQVGASREGKRRFAKVESRTIGNGRFEVLHHLATEKGGAVVLRAAFWGEKGNLRLKWDMPGTERGEDGTPRYTALHVGPGTEAPSRVYAGMGNVLVEPKRLDLRADGVSLATRHVGADYPCGLSVVQASEVFPDYFVVRGASRKCYLLAHHDTTFSFAPSRDGAFAAAVKYARVAGFERSPGYGTCAGRICLDTWYGSFAADEKSVRRYAEFAVTNAVFIKHGMQRWGFDYRFPETYPAAPGLGGTEGLKALRDAAVGCGMCFGVHENYIDYFPDAEGFSYDSIAFRAKSGEPATAWYNPSRRAQSYKFLPTAIFPWVERNQRLAREQFAPNALFIDVFSAMQPLDVYDRQGRFIPRTECARCWGLAFDKAREFLGVPHAAMVSETGTDALVGHLDAGQADHSGGWSGAKRGEDYADAERVPWHDVATHGKFILMGGGLENRYAGTRDESRLRLHGYGSDDYLENTAIGGRMPMCEGAFRRESVLTDWLLRGWWASVADAGMASFEFFEGDIHRRTATFSNGAVVHSNRGSNTVWNVNGAELPQYGFIAKGPGFEGGVVLKNGQRVAYAKGRNTFFADARPVYSKLPWHAMTTWLEGAETIGRNRLKLDLKWCAERPLAGKYRCFLQALKKGCESEGPILFGSEKAQFPDEALSAPGKTFDGSIVLDVGDKVAEGEYELRYGISVNGRREPLNGVIDGQRRARAGILKVVKSEGRVASLEWTRPRTREEVERDECALEGRNVGGELIDFCGIRTDGTALLEFGGRGMLLRVPPGARSFRWLADLSWFGAKGRRVKSVRGVDGTEQKWQQKGDRLGVSFDGKFAEYRIEFQN